MPIVADEYTHVIGVDTHAKTHAYVILDTRTGGMIDTATFPTNPAGLARALAWIDRRTSAGRLAAVNWTPRGRQRDQLLRSIPDRSAAASRYPRSRSPAATTRRPWGSREVRPHRRRSCSSCRVAH